MAGNVRFGRGPKGAKGDPGITSLSFPLWKKRLFLFTEFQGAGTTKIAFFINEPTGEVPPLGIIEGLVIKTNIKFVASSPGAIFVSVYGEDASDRVTLLNKYFLDNVVSDTNYKSSAFQFKPDFSGSKRAYVEVTFDTEGSLADLTGGSFTLYHKYAELP